MEKRSLNAGNVDLTPKLKVVLNPEKIKDSIFIEKHITVKIQNQFYLLR